MKKGCELMSNIGNKEVMAKNLEFYANRSGKTQRELAEVAGVAPSTFNDWMKAKKYPRIDKIEKLADYFGIMKSDLIEEKMTEEMDKKNNVLSDIIVRMRMDDDFLSVAKMLYSVDSEKLSSVKQMLNAFLK
jgi:transcriptional regulator with XRE-family HTH domain